MGLVRLIWAAVHTGRKLPCRCSRNRGGCVLWKPGRRWWSKWRWRWTSIQRWWRWPMIERHNRCVGIKLFRYRKHQLELWVCPRSEIVSHSHQNIDSNLIFLWGSIYGTIGERSGFVDWRDSLRRFPIAAGVKHSATILSRFCLFLNWETWNTPKVTSAATDFHV